MPRRITRKKRPRERWNPGSLELLGLVALGVIVVSLALPLAFRHRARGFRGMCAGNLRRLGLALRAYATDWDGSFPKWSLVGGAPGGMAPEGEPYTWDTQIAGRIGGPEELFCKDNEFGAERRSYAMPVYVSGVPEAKMPDPSQVVLLFEKGAYPPGAWNDAAGENLLEDTGERIRERFRHGDGQNFLFADGRVAFVKGDDPLLTEAQRGVGKPGDCLVAAPAPTGDWPLPR